MLYPLKLAAPLKDYIWGGTRLKDEYGKTTDLDRVAESWELSCHRDGQSIIQNGPEAGKSLMQYLEEQGSSVLGRNAGKFPYFPLLIKLIDARDDLSVQVHPDNEYAMRVEGEPGKTELWYIVDAEPGASLLYGFSKEIGREEFLHRARNGTILEVCNRVPVKKGDVFFIASGTLHAIGKGILLCEIQQNSNTTYRIYDYGRLGKDGSPRELHLEKAADVVRLAPPPSVTKPAAHIDILSGAEVDLLASCEYFTAYHVDLRGSLQLKAGQDSFQSLTVLSGSLQMDAAGGKAGLGKGETAFLPAGLGDYSVAGQAEFILGKV